MAVLKSYDSPEQLKIDAGSHALRATLYNTDGNPLASLPVTLDNAALAALEQITATLDPASLAALEQITATISDGLGPLTVDGIVAVSNPGLTNTELRAASLPVLNPEMRAATNTVSVTGAAAAAVTATLPAAGAGLYHYLTYVEISLYSAAARAGTAAPVVATSTNLPGPSAWTFATAGAIGTIDRVLLPMTTPLRAAAANTATTIVCPAVTGGIWRVNVAYFTGP